MSKGQSSVQGSRRNTHHLPSVSVASANISSLPSNRRMDTQSLPSERPSYKLHLPSHPPTNHIDNPVHVFAQSDVDARPLGAATAKPPAHQTCQLVPFSNLAGQRTSRVSLHIRLKISVVLPECQFHPFILPDRRRLLQLSFRHKTCCPSPFLGSTGCINHVIVLRRRPHAASGLDSRLEGQKFGTRVKRPVPSKPIHSQ